MKQVIIKAKDDQLAPFGYATGRNGGFDPRRVEVWKTATGDIVRIDAFSRAPAHNAPLVLGLHKEYAREVAQAILQACGD